MWLFYLQESWCLAAGGCSKPQEAYCDHLNKLHRYSRARQAVDSYVLFSRVYAE